jgi:hypothetical protein
MILMQAHWLKLRSGMTMKRLVSWSDGFIHWSRNWFARNASAVPPKRISAK